VGEREFIVRLGRWSSQLSLFMVLTGLIGMLGDWTLSLGVKLFVFEFVLADKSFNAFEIVVFIPILVVPMVKVFFAFWASRRVSSLRKVDTRPEEFYQLWCELTTKGGLLFAGQRFRKIYLRDGDAYVFHTIRVETPILFTLETACFLVLASVAYVALKTRPDLLFDLVCLWFVPTFLVAGTWRATARRIADFSDRERG
jgi:hypothetical protein